MLSGIEPGLLILLLHLSAGFAFCAVLACLAVAASGIRIHGLPWLLVACLLSAASQLATAQFHQATDVSIASDCQRWMNGFASAQLFFITAFIATYTRYPHRRRLLIGMAGLSLILLALTIHSPTGTRFIGEFHSEIMTLPWGERLQILVGTPNPGVFYGRVMIFLIYFWNFYRTAVYHAKVDRQGAIVICAGLLMLMFGVAIGGFVESGEIRFIYTGGFGYVILTASILVVLARKLVVANTRQRRIIDALRGELSRHRETRKIVHHLSYNDRLTSLPSRVGLFERILVPIEMTRLTGRGFAMLHIDIDRFDVINDTLGPNVGDRLLQQVSRRLHALIQDTDFVARLNADEFICVHTRQPVAQAASQLADSVHAGLRAPFEIDTHTLHITASIGIACFPEDADTAETLLVAADLATREAKRQGRNRTQFYQPGFNTAIQERMRVGNALRVAIEQGQLELYVQPQVDAGSGRVVSAEALIRWHHPEDGMIAPVRFIPVAEEMHLMDKIGAWVIEEACRIRAEWQRQGIVGVRLAINLSAQQLRDPALLDTIRQALAQHGLSGGDIEMEVTESMVMEDADLCIDRLRQISAMGIKLAMDDFGTGYSSLAYLKQLPINTLKIDRSFVKDIDTDSNDAAICATTISMAKTLGMDTVAEGVETEAQASLLRELRCERFQGYFYARPMPVAEATAFVKRHLTPSER